MSVNYKSILVAVDLNEANDELLLRKALSLAKLEQAPIYLVHAVEPLDPYGTASAYYALGDIEATIAAEHTETIQALAKGFNINLSMIYIATGAISTVINNLAKKLQADLIVVGSHGRHGLRLLLGSHTDSIIHHSPCDVLAVQLPK